MIFKKSPILEPMNKPQPTLFYSSVLLLISSLGLSAVETEVVLQLNQMPQALEIADSSGTRPNAITFGPFGAEFRGAGNNGRNYLRTIEDRFGETDFEASVVWNGSGQMFFGIGGGDLGSYGTPDWQADRNDSVWLEMLPNGGSTLSRISNAYRIEMPRPFNRNHLVNRPTRVVWDYNAASRTITFSADTDYTGGEFIADLQSPPISVDDLFEAGEAFRIFFGGEGGTVSEAKIHYIPEPSAIALMLGISVLLPVVRRRRVVS